MKPMNDKHISAQEQALATTKALIEEVDLLHLEGKTLQKQLVPWPYVEPQTIRE